MANYHAVYIDSPSSWTYAPDSYDSKLGFYTNAWLTNQTEEESETPVISCSYFYEIGKEDDVGFTPRRINYNSSSGILTVEGKQSGVPSLVSKSFRKKSPSPRFLNLRESLRKRRPARFMVSQIITDDNDSLENIKKYLGIDEKGEEKSAEGIGSILGNVIPEPHFVGYEEIKKEKMKNQNMKDAEEFGAESSPVIWDSKKGQLIDPPMFTVWVDGEVAEHFNTFEEALEFAKNDIEEDEEAQITISYYETLKNAEEFDEAGYSLNMDRFSYQNEGKVIGIGGKELRQYRIYFGKEPMFYLNDAVFGYDNNNTVQEVVDDLNEALKDSIEEVFQRLLWKSQRHDSLDVMLRSEDFGAENWRFSKEYDNYYTTMNARTGTGFYGDVIVSGYGYDEKEGREIEKEIVGLSIFLRKKISEWMQDRTNRASNLKWSGRKGNRTISKISHSAEEFGADTADVDFDEAYMERQDAERIMKLLRIVKRKATGSNARYAKTYADAAEMAYYDYGFKGLKTQVAYVLSNLGGWRGDEAKQVKAELRKLMR